jgi:TonB-dependent receptor
MAYHVARQSVVPSRRQLRLGVSALAMICAGQMAVAQDQATPPPSDQVEPAKPAGSGSSGTFSGTAGAETGTGQTAQGSASSTSGTSGSTDAVDVAPPETERDEIVVTGVRQSLANAQNIKRNSDTVVDAITAEDIGALPDRSVNEALQRVPGVAISRFAAPNDSQHFSAQGSGVVIRGLSYVRGEFNGRDAFAAGGGREIGFNDIPSEIVGSVEVFKNLTADLIEGGISGTVNINTRKPFDTNEDLFFLSLGGNIGDLEGRAAPQGVALLSRQFDVGGGRFGVLASATYQQVLTRSDSVFIASPIRRFNDDTNRNGVQDAGEGRILNAGTSFSSPVFDLFPVPTGFQSVYVPLGAGARTQNFDRERIGVSGALQYENADRSLLVTAQYLRAESKEDWIEHTNETNNYYGDLTQVFPAPGTQFTFDDDGIFTSGLLTQPNNTGALGTRFNTPQGENGSYGVLQFDPNGIRTSFSNRHFYSKSVAQDHSLNVKWSPTDRLRLNFDGQYVKSNVESFDDVFDVHTFSQVRLDQTGGIPQISFVVPSGDTAGYFANPDQLFPRNAFNGIQQNDGREYAFRADAQYDFSEVSFLRNVRVGGRYADRKQTVRAVDYNNWGNVSETWES